MQWVFIVCLHINALLHQSKCMLFVTFSDFTYKLKLNIAALQKHADDFNVK